MICDFGYFCRSSILCLLGSTVGKDEECCSARHPIGQISQGVESSSDKRFVKIRLRMSSLRNEGMF